MRSVKATFNYTARKRIERELVTLAAGDDNGHGFIVLERMAISHLGLESNAKLILDCKSSVTGTIRFDLGTIDSPAIGARFPFPKEVLPAVTLTLKVVSQSGSHKGRILASCRGLRPSVGGRPQSLLPVVPAALGDSVWHLHFDHERGPELQLNESIENFFEVYRNPVFLALVMPEVVCRIAVWAYGRRDEPDDTELGTVIKEWRLLLLSWGFDIEDVEDEEEAERQASSCSQTFASRHRYLQSFLGILRSES